MTSHYLRSIVKGSFNDVFEALSSEFGDIYSRKFSKPGESLRGLILGERYFFRVENDAALLVLLEEVSHDETRIEIIACAAGKGLMDITSARARAIASYTAHDSYVHTVQDFLVKSGFLVRIEKEISYFDRTQSTN